MELTKKVPGRDFTYGEYAAMRRRRRKGKGAQMTLTIAYTSTQFVFKWKAPATSTLIFAWGDGTTSTVSGNDSTLVTTTSAYSGAGTYTFSLHGDVTDLTYIDISAQAFVSGDVSGWSVLTNLTSLYAYSTGISGDVSGWSVLTSLTVLRVNSTSVSGNVEGFAALTSLTYLRFNSTSVTGDVSLLSTLTSLTYFRFSTTAVTFDTTAAFTQSSSSIFMETCSMTSTQVDNMIESFSTCTSCTINVAGTNAHRTAASNADLNTLLANGNTITLNDTLGAELHTNLNAANDSATEAITAFADYAATIDGGTQVTIGQDISDMLPLGSEEVTDGDMDVGGSWTLDSGWSIGSSVATCDGTENAKCYQQISGYEAQKYYLVSVEVTAYTSGDLNVYFTGGVNQQLNISGTGTYNHVFNDGNVQAWLNIRSQSGDGFVGSIDNISVKEIEVLGSDLVTNGTFTANADLQTSNCANDNYTSFANGTPNGFDATSDGGGLHSAGTADEVSFVSGQKYVITFDLVLNSGTAPKINIYSAAGGGSAISVEGLQDTAAGYNVFEFESTFTLNGVVRLLNSSTATDFEITNLSVSDSVTDWTNGDGWIVADGLAKCDGSQAGLSALYQAEAFDDSYSLWKFTVSNYSAGGVAIRSSGTVYYPSNPTAGGIQANGTYSILVYNDGTYDNIALFAGATFVGDIDNVSVHKLLVTKEIAASTAYTGTHYVLPEAGADNDSFIIPVTYAAEGIVAQLITGETNATTGWIPTGLTGTGANVFESQQTVVNTGVFALHIDANDTPTGSCRIDGSITVENAAVYRIMAEWRHIGSGGTWAFQIEGVNAGELDNTDIAFEDLTYYYTAADTTLNIRIRETSTNDGGVYLDNIKVQKVTFT